MKFQLNKEIPFWIMTFSPAIYLAINWDNIPALLSIPNNLYDYDTTNQLNSKMDILGLAVFPPLLTYLALLAALYIDPKNRLKEMGNKYDQLRFFIIAIVSAIIILFITNVIFQTANFEQPFCLLIGGLFALIGNYAQSLKPNYFIGFRTPWTLENEDIWKRTHQLGGKVWFWGGLFIVLINLLLDLGGIAFPILLSIIVLLAAIPIIYSFKEYQQL